jgi:ADP-heptose:LPS heptosyltransferase
MESILVMRLSSMGDVLLTLPVLAGILEENKELQVLFVTREKFAPYFTGIERLKVINFEPESIHKGIPGLFRFFREIRGYVFDKVFDLHGNLRTSILDFLMKMDGCQVFRIKKHRAIRRRAIKERDAGIMVPHAIDRYLDVFARAGFDGMISSSYQLGSGFARDFEKGKSEIKRIGIAPISKHRTKNWGLTNISELIHLVDAHFKSEIHLFGGIEDQLDLSTLTGKNIFNHAGKADPREEISLIQSMDVFISMDSANMHLASLIGTPTISIWGATDPKMGFAPINQPIDFAIHSDLPDVYCRPCSVYGEVPCKRKDSPMICMTSIAPQRVFNKILEILGPSDIKS